MAEKQVSRFPKEFKKKHLISFDWRFLVILLLSLVAHVGIILFLEAHLPKILQARHTSHIQQQYANLILESDQNLERILPPETLDLAPPRMLTRESGPAAAPGAAGDVVPGGPGGAVAVGPPAPAGAGSAVEGLPTVAEMERGVAGGRVRGRNLSDVVGEVGSVGLLRILSSGSGVVEGDYIASITSFGDTLNSQLDQALGSLDATRVARGPGGKGWASIPNRDENPAGGRITTGSRGSRRSARALDVDNLIGALQPQGSVEFEDINRVRDYETLSDLGGDMRPARPTTPEEKARLRRTPEQVMAVVDAHRPAIIDCYKSLLRNYPNLKGKIEVRFAVDPDGRVSMAEVVSTTIPIERLTNCVLTRIRNWNDFGYGDPTEPDEVYRQVFTFGY